MSTPPTEPRFHNREILIVAETRGDAHLLQALLQASDLEAPQCTLADRADEACQWLDNDVPDAVVFDLGRGDLQGLNRLDALTRSARRAPIVVVSDHDDEWLRRHVITQGVVEFVPKQHVDAERLAESVRLALEVTLATREGERVCPVDERDAFASIEDEASHDLGTIAEIVSNVCRVVHNRFRSDVHIISDVYGPMAVPMTATTVRRALENLLVGLCAASREVKAGGLKLHIRTSCTSTVALVSIDAFADDRCDEYRKHVSSLLVEQRSDPLMDHHLTEASVAIGDLGGNLRSRSCEDGRLWLQVDLPRATASRHAVAHAG